MGHLSRHPLSSRNALIRDLVLALMSSILNQERRTWTRSVGTKNCSSPALPKDGSMIWDEGLRITLHSVQRYIVSGITSPDVSPGITSCAAASLPDEVGLASCRRHPCVLRKQTSTFFFLARKPQHHFPTKSESLYHCRSVAKCEGRPLWAALF